MKVIIGLINAGEEWDGDRWRGFSEIYVEFGGNVFQRILYNTLVAEF